MNLATFLACWQDKYAAQTAPLASQETRHLWSLAGGWGGAWLAQRVLRHKSVKARFRSTYWLTVMTLAAIRWTGYPYFVYYTAKAAVNQATVALAMQYARHGIRANAILPGAVEAPLIYREILVAVRLRRGDEGRT